MSQKFRMVVEVEYENLYRTPEEMETCLERELARHIDDGLLLFDEKVEQYTAEVEHIKNSAA